jgi:hypothetical protein
MENEHTTAPKWFKGMTIVFLIWNIMGLLSFVAHVFITEEAIASLPDNERALYGEYPLWTVIAFAVAVIGGFVGSVGLMMKKHWCKMAFIISLIGIIPQMIHNLFFTSSIEVYGPVQASGMPIMVVIVGVYLVWLSNYAAQKNWLK